MTNCCCKVTFVVGVLIILLTIGLYFLLDLLLQKQIHKQLLLKENSNAFKNWLNPPVIIYRKYYLFSVNNPYEVSQGLEKPDLIEFGPYVYREVLEKRNPVFSDDDRLTYSPVSTLYFEPSLSNGTQDDLITFVNIPAVAMIEDAAKTGMTFLIAGMLRIFNIKLFVTRTVNELITGYDDSLMNLAKYADPNKVKTSKFSLINDKNGTISHNITIQIGSDNIQNAGKVYSWNGIKKLSTWSSENANEIKGYDGIMYPPYLTRDKQFYTFNVEMCRSLKWVYSKDNLVDGIKTLDFHLPSNVFYSSNPDNDGFCSGGDCLGDGVFNMSRCQGGLSMFASLPHFLNADEKFINSVKGLNPNKDKHDYLLSIEPTTGAPVKASARIQLNIYVNSNEDLEMVKNVKPVLLPIFWIEVDADIYLETKQQLGQINFINKMLPLAHLALLCLGVVSVLISIIVILTKQIKLV